MGEKIKERDYMFDTFRGILMLSIPVSHFTKASANWYQALYEPGFAHVSFCGFMYITINVFVMQAFMFLSGYFSKTVPPMIVSCVGQPGSDSVPERYPQIKL